MAASMIIPEWLTRNYDPVGKYLQAYQIGSNVAQTRVKLAEDARQANMQAQLQSAKMQMESQADAQRLQDTSLRAQAENAIQSAFNQAQLRQADEKLKVTQAQAAQEMAIEIAKMKSTESQSAAKLNALAQPPTFGKTPEGQEFGTYAGRMTYVPKPTAADLTATPLTDEVGNKVEGFIKVPNASGGYTVLKRPDYRPEDSLGSEKSKSVDVLMAQRNEILRNHKPRRPDSNDLPEAAAKWDKEEADLAQLNNMISGILPKTKISGGTTTNAVPKSGIMLRYKRDASGKLVPVR